MILIHQQFNNTKKFFTREEKRRGRLGKGFKKARTSFKLVERCE